MKNKILVPILFLTAFSFLRCIEEFTPRIPDSEADFLIVEGRITDEAGPYSVRLSRSIPINSNDKFPVSGASVQIEEEGTIHPLTDQGNGLYSTDGFQGQANRNYRLLISLDGNQYESSWQTLQPSSEIDSIYYQVGQEETEDREYSIGGIQWFVDSHNEEESGARYYRYEWDETWQTGVKWSTFYNYLGNDLIELITPPEERHNTCWIDNPSGSINLTSTISLSGNIVSAHPLFFAQDVNERLSVKYSLLVRQYALDEEEYQFLKALRASNIEGGNLFDKQPASVVGNIRSLSNPDITVLGYFSANGVSEQRVFVRNEELPEGFGEFYVQCELDSILKSHKDYEDFVFSQIKGRLIFFDLIRANIGGAILGLTLAEPECVDCVFGGGDTQRPDFWE